MIHRYSTHCVALSLCIFGTLSCVTEPTGVPRDEATKNTSRFLAKAGSVSVDLPEYRKIITEARILRHWMSGQPAPAKALSNERLRRRLLIDGLETRLIRRHMSLAGLEVESPLFSSLLGKALLGIAPNQSVSPEQLARMPDDVDTINRKLVARYSQSAERIRDVIHDVAERHTLAQNLLKNAPMNEIQSDWEMRNRCVTATLYRISRVPSSAEIDRAIREQSHQIEEYYRRNPRLFHRDTRVFVRRLVQPFDPKDPVDEQAKRKQMQAWRKEVVDGGNLETLVQKHGPVTDRRSGGRLKLKKEQRPDLHALKKGAVSPIETVNNHLVFYKVLGHAPGIHRLLSDVRVQRECAAGVLRETNALPSVLETTDTLIRHLRSRSSDDALAQFIKAKRIRHKPAKMYCQSQGTRVPGIGLAEDLVPELLALDGTHRVSPAVQVRQDFVVAHYIDGKRPTPQAWAMEKEQFVRSWRKRMQPRIVDKWLTQALTGKARWIDQVQLKALATSDLIEEQH